MENQIKKKQKQKIIKKEPQGSRWRMSQIRNKRSDYNRASDAASSSVAQSWLWGSQVADKKTKFFNLAVTLVEVEETVAIL